MPRWLAEDEATGGLDEFDEVRGGMEAAWRLNRGAEPLVVEVSETVLGGFFGLWLGTLVKVMSSI